MRKANYSQISRVPSCTRPPMCLGLVTDRRLFLCQMRRVRGADQRMSAKHRDKQKVTDFSEERTSYSSIKLQT